MEGDDRVDLARFYSRRVRRLLPAASLTLIVTLVVYAAVTDAPALDSARTSARFAFVYLANWSFIQESTDYFATDLDANPFLHFWSLAVEEQFYLFWPIVLLLLAAATRRLPGSSIRWMQGLVVLGITCSGGLALAWRAANPDRAYFGTDTRAYQLLAGALIAMAPGLVRRVSRVPRAADVAAATSLLVLVAVASSWWTTSAIVRGMATTVLTVGILVGMEASPRGLTARAAGTGLMTYLGRISYGTYLWHWPVLVILHEVWPMTERAAFIVASVLATALAALSFEALEQPVRTWKLLDRWPAAVATSGIAIGLLAATFAVTALPEASGATRRSTVQATPTELSEYVTPVPATFDYGEVWFGNETDYVSCADGSPADCTVHTGSGPHLVLMGDSTMHAIVPGFVAMAEKYDLTLSLGTRPGCPWPAGLYVLTPAIQESCKKLKDDFYDRVLPALQPDVVLLLDAGPDADVDTTDPSLSARSTAYVPAVVASVPMLLELADQVVLIEPLPKITPLMNPLQCLRDSPYVEDCRFEPPAERSWIEDLYDRVADENTGAITIDIDHLACRTLPTCEAMIDGTVTWWDGQHIAAGFAATWADPLYRELAAVGVVPPVEGD